MIISLTVGFVGGLAGILGNIKTIGQFFGFMLPEPMTLELRLIRLADVDADKGTPNAKQYYTLTFDIRKAGPDPMRGCRFEAWVAHAEARLIYLPYTKPFILPPGTAAQTMEISILRENWFMGKMDAKTTLVCDQAVSNTIKTPLNYNPI
jgi:hypothetical protein